MQSMRGAVQGRDTSVRGIISKGRFVQGAQHPRTFGRGHIGWGDINLHRKKKVLSGPGVYSNSFPVLLIQIQEYGKYFPIHSALTFSIKCADLILRGKVNSRLYPSSPCACLVFISVDVNWQKNKKNAPLWRYRQKPQMDLPSIAWPLCSSLHV